MEPQLPILLVDRASTRRARLTEVLSGFGAQTWGVAVGSALELDQALRDGRFRLCLLAAPPLGLTVEATSARLRSADPSLLVLRLSELSDSLPQDDASSWPIPRERASSLVHDLNNMLGVVLSYASVLLDELAEAAPERESVLEISLAALRAKEITKSLLPP